MKSGELVIPGTEVGYSEEFIPGNGTYEEDGKIYASTTGILKVDPKERRISVEVKTSTPAVPSNGDTVIGIVADVKQQFAVVDIVKIKGVERELSGNMSGSIHISKTRDTYVSDLSREFSSGDIIIAKISDSGRSPISLTTVSKELGVIRGYCSQCNTPLVKVNDKLKCENCNQVVQKKISTEYGKGDI